MPQRRLDFVESHSSAHRRRAGKTNVEFKTNRLLRVHAHLDVARSHRTQLFRNANRGVAHVRKKPRLGESRRAFMQFPPHHDTPPDAPVPVAKAAGRIFLRVVADVLLDKIVWISSHERQPRLVFDAEKPPAPAAAPRFRQQRVAMRFREGANRRHIIRFRVGRTGKPVRVEPLACQQFVVADAVRVRGAHETDGARFGVNTRGQLRQHGQNGFRARQHGIHTLFTAELDQPIGKVRFACIRREIGAINGVEAELMRSDVRPDDAAAKPAQRQRLQYPFADVAAHGQRQNGQQPFLHAISPPARRFP